MTTFGIILAIFFYILLKWAMRVIFLLVILKIVAHAKSKMEADLKEKLNNFKREGERDNA